LSVSVLLHGAASTVEALSAMSVGQWANWLSRGHVLTGEGRFFSGWLKTSVLTVCVPLAAYICHDAENQAAHFQVATFRFNGHLAAFGGSLAALAAFTLCPAQALAFRLVSYPLTNNADGNNGFNYSVLNTSVLSASTLAKGPGLGTFTVGTENYSGVPMQALSAYPSTSVAGATAADALANDWYYTVSLTPASTMTISSIGLDWSRGGTSGVRGWFVRSSLDNYASDLYANETPDGTAKQLQPVSINLLGFTGLNSQTDFRFYIYTSSSGRSMNFANLTFSADGPEPAPGPLPLLGAAAAFAWSQKLRRRVLRGASLDAKA
jgi:MYXO-CTERM domain-containing protein